MSSSVIFQKTSPRSLGWNTGRSGFFEPGCHKRQLPLRHRSSVHPDTTLVCLVRLHLRMQTNLLSFANESICITMPVFSLQIISHSKQDTIN